MAFKGISDKEIKEQLASSQGIARPTAKDYLMDFMSIAPAMMGMPAMMAPPAGKLPRPSKVGELYSGKAYRVESGNMGISHKTTAKDIIDFEADELGNELVRKDAEAVAKKLGVDLSSLTSEDIVWVTRNKQVAKDLYGYGVDEPVKVNIPKNSVILSDIGEDGVLVLKGNALPKPFPIKKLSKPGR